MLAVPAARIQDGSLRFTDEKTKASYAIADLDGTIEARVERDTVRIRTDLELGGVRADLRSGGGAAYGPLALAIRGQVAHAPATGHTLMHDLVLALEAIELQVNGSITTARPPAPGAAAPPPELDLRLASGRFEPARVLSLVPGAAPKNLKLAGNARLTAAVRGAANAPAIDGALTLEGVSVTPPGHDRPLLTALAGEARFTRSTLTASPLRGQLAGNPFTLSATVEDFARPRIRGSLDLAAPVADLAALATLPPDLKLERGKVRLDVDFETQAPKFVPALQLTGTARGEGIAGRLPGIPVPLSDLTFDARLAGRGATITPFRLNLGRSDLAGKLELARFDAPSLTFDVTSRLLDLDELAAKPVAAAPAPGAGAASAPKSGAGREPAKGDAAAPGARASASRPAGLPARGSARAGEIRWRGLTARDASLEVTLDRRGIQVENLRAGLMGGTVTGDLTVDLTDPDSLRYTSDLKVAKVQANDLISAFTPAKNLIYGELNSELDLAGVRAGQAPPLALLTAIGNATVAEGYLAVRGPLVPIMKQLGLLTTATDRLDFQKLSTVLRIDSGRVRLSDANLKSGRYGDFLLSGSVGLDGSIDYDVHALLPKRYMPPELLAQKELLNLIADPSGRLPLDFAITGSVSNPKVKLDLRKLEAQVANRAKSQIQAQADSVLKKVTGQAEGGAGTATEKVTEDAKKAIGDFLGSFGKKKPAPADTGQQFEAAVSARPPRRPPARGGPLRARSALHR